MADHDKTPSIEQAATRNQPSRWRRFLRLITDQFAALLHDDLSERIEQVPEYRQAREQAMQDTVIRGINR